MPASRLLSRRRRRSLPDTGMDHAAEDFRLGLNDLADPRDVRQSLQETAYLARLTAPDLDPAALERAFEAAVKLHTGNCPGFPAGTDCLQRLETACAAALAMARLLHGAHVMGHRFDAREVLLPILAALLHDPGDGLGGPNAGDPAFALDHMAREGFPADDAEDCARLVRCAAPDWTPGTPEATRAEPLNGIRDDVDMTGCMLASAVLLARVADHRGYARIAEICLRSGKTLQARQALDYIEDEAMRRLRRHLGSVHTLMLPHFGHRWGLDRDLYMESARESRDMLAAVLERMTSDAALS